MTDELTPFYLREQAERDNDRSHQKAIRKKEAENLWAWMLSGPQGRRFIWNLMQSCGHGETSFNTNGSMMAFAEGRKSVAYGIEKMAQQVAPEAWLKMIEENHDRHD